VAPPLEAPLMKAPLQILILQSEPSLGGKLGSYPYLLFRIALIIFTLAYLLFCISIALEKKIKIFITFIIAS
jgi:hypothetical protein